RRRAIRLGLGGGLWPGYHGPRWTRKQIKLLGARPDAEIALLTGRTEGAVRQKREELAIPQFRVAGDLWHWTAEGDGVGRTLLPKDAVAKTGRTLDAVYSRRHDLKLQDGRVTTEGDEREAPAAELAISFDRRTSSAADGETHGHQGSTGRLA